jgi:hypothetical protein
MSGDNYYIYELNGAMQVCFGRLMLDNKLLKLDNC